METVHESCTVTVSSPGPRVIFFLTVW